MKHSRPPVPTLRRQKEKGRADRAFVVLDGRRIPCGRWGTPEARQRYDRAIAEWLAGGRRSPVRATEQITVAVMVDRFLHHAEQYYRKPDGTKEGAATTEVSNFEQIAKPLLHLYADTLVEDFTPHNLRAVRQRMVDHGWSRPYINAQAGRVRRMFKWASAQKLCSPNIHRAMADVEPLKAGRTEAHETEPVKPVADAMVEDVLPYLTPTLQAMIRFQQHTGARPGEVCAATTGAIDAAGEVWTYKPAHHKTTHHGKDRTIFIGPNGQDAIRPYLKTSLDAPLFSPIQSERERREAEHARRKTPLKYGNAPGTNRKRKPERKPAAKWTTQSYGRAIQRACDDAFPPPEHLQRRRVEADGRKAERWETNPEYRARLIRDGLAAELDQWRKDHRWAPNQLRHTYATRVRREHGLEVAQVMLGHSKADTTQVYAERDMQKGIETARQIG